MIGFITDAVLYSSFYIVRATFNGLYYITFGTSSSKEVEREQNTIHVNELQKYYWKQRHTFTQNEWVVIAYNIDVKTEMGKIGEVEVDVSPSVLISTSSKVDALKKIVEYNTPTTKNCLLVQVGNETTMCEL